MICRKTRAKRCQQVMGDLPQERTRPSAPFEFTAVDLFGPYPVKYDVKRTVTMKVWGVMFCCMDSRAKTTRNWPTPCQKKAFWWPSSDLQLCKVILRRFGLVPSLSWRRFLNGLDRPR